MELTDWLSCIEKPDYNGVYERRELSKPDSSHSYCLYKNGWHIDCDTIEAAAQSTEKPCLNFRTTAIGTKVFEINRKAPEVQWRGLAKRPNGIKVEMSNNYDNLRYRMPPTTALPHRISSFLDRPETKGEKSKVFILFYSNQFLQNLDDAIDYLKTEASIPLLLLKREKGENTCVEVECLGREKLVFGFSPPSGNPSNDLREIMDWLDKSEIPAELVS